MVRQTGFADYILVVNDFAQHARRLGIRMAIRGSAAASIILYCLGVTEIDPLEHRLVFERFLNVERREMPDVDIDFAEDRRDEMIRYAAEKYGHDRVAQIITFGTLGAKASIRDVGRALGMTYADVDRVARLVPAMPASFGVMTIDKALEEGAGAARGVRGREGPRAYRHGARRSRAWPATPARTPPASSSRRSRWRTSCRCSGHPPATRPRCRRPSTR